MWEAGHEHYAFALVRTPGVLVRALDQSKFLSSGLHSVHDLLSVLVGGIIGERHWQVARITRALKPKLTNF